MVTSEAAPFAKTGGLADVLGSLPPALVDKGEEVAVVIPAYGTIDLRGSERIYNDLTVWMDGGGGRYDCSIHRFKRHGVDYLFVNCPALYGRQGIYGDRHGEFGDNHIRFAVLCRAALGIASRVFRPDVIHCHDWQSGLVPLYLKSTFRHDPVFYGIKTVLTIHNLGYQGRYGAGVLPYIAVPPSEMHPGGIEYFGDVNYLKAGIVYSDYITTVSPRYAQEIQTPEFGFGLDALLRSRRFFISGILNGVDYEEWDPATDRYLPAHYTSESLAGKTACKKALLEEFNLPADRLDTRPLLGIVSRFAHQKGLDLVGDCIQGIADLGVQMVVLGSGDAQLEETFSTISAARPAQFGFRRGYNDGLAHRIEAGSDMFLMPSRYEPCGLNQIYSLKYGTVPVVRATGGLDDTVTGDTGFKFFGSNAHDLYNCVRFAVQQFANRDAWTTRMKFGMQQDFSWALSADRYIELYRRLTEH